MQAHRRFAHGLNPDAPVEKGIPAKVEVTENDSESAERPQSHPHRRTLQRKQAAKTTRLPAASSSAWFGRGPHPVEDINRLLKAVFNHPTRLSLLLRQAGWSRRDVRRLREKHLEAYLLTLMREWIAWWRTFLPPTGVAMLRKRFDRVFGQGGQDARVLKRLSGDQRQSALSAALAELRIPAHKKKLAQIVEEVARDISKSQVRN